MLSFKTLSFAIASLIFITACDQQTGTNTENTTGIAVESTNTSVISGVSSKGPISSALIEIYAFDANDGNESGTPIASTTTDTNGRWSVSIPTANHTTALLIKSSGGSYLDESDPEPDPPKKRVITFGPTDSILGALFPGFNTASVTMMTGALIGKSRTEANGANFLSVLNNNRNIAASALGFDPFTVASANPLAPSTASSVDSIEYAMYLGGMATALNSAAILMGKPIPDFAVVEGFIKDMADGRLNGSNQSGTVSVIVNGTPTLFPTTLDLNQAITRFRNNNFAAYSVTPVTSIVRVDETMLATSGVNSAPNAQDDIVTTIENTAVVTPNLLANDTDPDGDALSISGFSQSANGLVTDNNGSFTYTPNNGFAGSDIFSYTVDDGRGGNDTAQVIITVNATSTNSNPIAVTDTVSTIPDVPTTTPNLLTNDSDPDGDVITIASFTQPANGAVIRNNDGTFNFTPASGFSGGDSFTYTLSDGAGGSAIGTVIITVNAVTTGNVSPIANAGSDQSVNELITINLSGSGTDSDGTISAYQWFQVGGTTVTINNANTSTTDFTSPAVLIGNIDVLVFQLTVTDNDGGTDSDFITIIINPVVIAPIANAGTDQTLNELQAISLDGSASSDGTDGTITGFSWTQTSPVSPIATLSDPNIVNPAFTGPDIINNTTFSFQLEVTDNEGGTATDLVDINLVSLNSGPNVVDDSATADEDVLLVITNLLANDTDPENDTPLAINSVTQPTNGTVVIDAGNISVTYAPNLNFNGSDTFSYTANDSFGATGITAGQVSITVNPVNDDPVANADTGSVVQGFPLILSGLTLNDTDLEGDTLSITGVTQPVNGVSVNNINGTVTYTPGLTFNGTDSFTYSIVDGNGGSAVGTINITVIADTDGDGVIDTVEATDSTDPTLADSDFDGFFDGHEKIVGTNPNLNTVFPTTTVISGIDANATGGVANNLINTNTTWTLASSPYLVQTDVAVSNATLTIEPGVVIKLMNGIDFIVNAGGILYALGNAPVPQHVTFTSDHDDTINGDTNGDGVATNPAAGDWNGIDFNQNADGTIRFSTVKNAATCISINNSSPIIDSVDIGDCNGYGINIFTSSGTRNSNMSSVNIIDYNGDGTSTFSHGIYIQSNSAATTFLNINNISISEPGNSTNEYGLYLLGSGGHFNGTIDNVTVTNPSGDGFNLLNQSSGDMTVTLSNLTVSGAAVNSLDVRDTSTSSGILDLVFDGTNSFTNSGAAASAVYFQNNAPDWLSTGSLTIDTAGYGLQLNNSAGSFHNITINNATIAGLFLQQSSIPTAFSNVTLTNSPTPYELNGQNIASITAINVGYDYSDLTVAKSYVRIGGALTANQTLAPDPLDSILTHGLSEPSVYRVISSMTVPSAVTMTVNDGAILKFNAGLLLYVSGSLIVGDGDGLGAKAVFTSILDDSVGGDTNGDTTTTSPAWNNWNSIRANTGSVIDIDNATISYNSYGVYHYNVQSTSLDISNTDFHDIYYYGLQLQLFSAQSLTMNLDNVSFTDTGVNTSYHGIYANINNTASFGGTWSNVTLNNIGGSGIYIDDSSTSAVDPTISGLTIADSGTVGVHGVQLIGSATTTPTFDNSSGNINVISDGSYNLTLQGVSGSYSNLTLDGASTSSIYISGGADPTLGAWEDSSIILTNSPSPYTLLTNFPASIGTLGTADLGYNTGSSSFTSSYIATGGTLGNSTFIADPLNTGNNTSLYRVTSSITVPTGTTMTVEDGAVLKFNAGLLLYVSGSLIVGDGDGLGAKAVFTSILDDSVGGDTNGDTNTTSPAWNNWNSIRANTGSVIDIDNATISYNSYGVYHYNVQSTSLDISNTDFHDVYYYGLQLQLFSAQSLTMNLDNVSFTDTGVNTSYHGIYADIDTTASLGGTWNNVTLNNIGGSGIYINDSSTSAVDPTISGLTIADSGTIGVHGVQLLGSATTTPTFDNSSGNSNVISGGTYNMTLQGVGGSYSNMTLDGATSSSLYFSNNANPSAFNGSIITLSNSPSPYTLVGMSLPAAVIVTPYQAGTGLVQDYVIFSGALINDLTLTANPLGGTFWRVTSDLDVPSGRTLTIEANTLIKFDNSRYLDVLSGGTLNVNGTIGNEVIITSFTDNSVGTPNTALIGLWRGVRFNSGAAGGTVNYLTTWYGLNGVYISNVSTALIFNNLTINYSNEGLRLNSTTTTSPVFNNMAIYECSSTHLYLEGAGIMSPTFSGNLIITDIVGTNGTRGIYTSSADTTTLSGFTITGSNTGVEIAGNTGANRIENSVIRQAATVGISMSADGGPWVRNNIIVNNGYGNNNVNSFGGGISFNSGNGIIFGNLIRGNRAGGGAGIGLRNSSPTIVNNLIIENRSRANGTSLGGSGIDISGSSSSVMIKNNTIANNVSADIKDQGAGISTGVGSGATTLIDNIIYGNIDGASAANDVYDGTNNISTKNNNIIGTILIGSSTNLNLYTAAATDIVGSNPLFTNGWYLNVTSLQGGSNSPAIDAGSTLASLVTPFDLASVTTRTDGGDDGVADLPAVNIGYHYPGIVKVPNNANTVVSPASSTVNGLVLVVTITITPRDAVPATIGAGLDVVANATTPARLGNVTDLGDGSYQVTYTRPSATTGSDTVTFTVNGIAITANAAISWTP